MLGLAERNSGYLFSSAHLSDYLAKRRLAMRDEVEKMDGNRFLNTSPDDLKTYLIERYSMEIPRLRREEWTADEQECQIDVRHDPSRWIDDRSRPVYVPGQLIEVHVPFVGEPEIFHTRANTYSTNPPRATLRGSSLILRYEIPHGQELDVRQRAERDLDHVDEALKWVINDLGIFNSALPTEAQGFITARRERLLANQSRVSALGIPLRQRSDAPKTYAAPQVRRKVVPTLPSASTAPHALEPALDDANYELILSIVQNMAHVMERSPSAFHSMDEEALRQHFLVQLNGQFEGAATGETFNVSGKTDILLRVNGRNIFIAECKFWRGPKQFAATIDQLLGYTAWRDTKTAIFVFARDTTMSTVLAGIQQVVPAHPNYKRSVSWKHETGFRYVLHHKDDPNRELVLTVLVFHVPVAGE